MKFWYLSYINTEYGWWAMFIVLGTSTSNFSFFFFSDSSNISINCTGQDLNLTCIVECGECESKDFSWKTVNRSEFKCSNEQQFKNTSDYKHVYNCIVPSSVKHNGTFIFWVQMNTGHENKTFNVTTGTFSLFVTKSYMPLMYDYTVHYCTLCIISSFGTRLFFFGTRLFYNQFFMYVTFAVYIFYLDICRRCELSFK